MVEDVWRYLRAEQAPQREALFELLRIPSVSAQREHAADVARAADWLAERLRWIGLEGVAVQPTAGHPVVFGQTAQRPGRPTVLIYGHYDVQPPEPLALWKTPPFEPTVRRGRLYARGAADDKGQLFIHLAVLEAWQRAGGGCPVNVKVLFEGEEEIGSPHLPALLRARARALACDVVLVSDTHMLGPRTPSITAGLRGICCCEIIVRTAKTDLHSGNWGGAVANPLQVLAELLVACKDPRSGKVRIADFYADVKPLPARWQRALAATPHDGAALLRALGVPAFFGERGYGTLARIGARPTFEINGVIGGYAGEGIKTVLPCEARAKVSMRLVPEQRPAAVLAALRRHLAACAPPHARVSVRPLENSAPAVRLDEDFPELEAARRAVARVFGREPLLALEGGSVPIVAEFSRTLRCPTLLLGFGLPDDNLHAPNEKLDLSMFERGTRTVALLFAELAAGS